MPRVEINDSSLGDDDWGIPIGIIPVGIHRSLSSDRTLSGKDYPANSRVVG